MKKLIISAVAVLTALGCIAADTAVFEAENFKATALSFRRKMPPAGSMFPVNSGMNSSKMFPFPKRANTVSSG